MDTGGGGGSEYALGPQKVRCGSATVLQPRLPSHGLHCNLGSQIVLHIVEFITAIQFHMAAPLPPWPGQESSHPEITLCLSPLSLLLGRGGWGCSLPIWLLYIIRVSS